MNPWPRPWQRHPNQVRVPRAQQGRWIGSRTHDMKVHVDQERCQGHGRCYAVAPSVFEPDEIGQGVEIGDGTVPPDQELAARRAVANCPEQAIEVIEDGTP